MVATGAISAVPATLAAFAAWRTHTKVAGNGHGHVTEIVARIEAGQIEDRAMWQDHVADPTAHQPKDPEP